MKEVAHSHEHIFSSRAVFEAPKSLTLQPRSPYAKDGSIIFMSEPVKDIKQQPIDTSENTSARDAWLGALSPEHRTDPDAMETIKYLVDMGLMPPTEQKPQTTDTSDMDDTTRLLRARTELNRTLSDQEQDAILRAHYVGDRELGKDGSEAGIGNYTREQLRGKAEVLNKGGITDTAERRKLMEEGITGKKKVSRLPEELEKLLVEEDGYELRRMEDAAAKEKSVKDRIAVADTAAMQAMMDKTIQNYKKDIGNRIAARRVLVGVPKDDALADFNASFSLEEERVQAALDAGDLDEARKVAAEIATKLFDQEKEYWRLDPEFRKHRNPENNQRGPENFDEMLKLIETSDTTKWGPYLLEKDGTVKHDKVTGEPLRNPNAMFDVDGNPSQANFKKWVQERMLYLTNVDPDATIQFFSSIAIESLDLYRPLSLQTMLGAEGTYFKSKDGTPLTELKDEITDMIWIDGTFVRNGDVQYRTGMSNDSNFADMFVGLFGGNTPGKESQRTGLNTMANYFIMDSHFDPESKPGEGDMQIGMATDSAFLFYYNMTDKEKLGELFGKNLDTFFSEQTFELAINEVMMGNNKNPEDPSAKQAFLKQMKLTDYKDYFKDGKVDPNKIEEFLLEMNVFSPPQKSRLKIALGRNLVKKVAGLESGLLDDKIENFSEGMKSTGELDYGETRAFWLSHMMGAASRQDVTFAAVNAMTKVTRFKQYLQKQADPSRAGGIGNPREFSLLKSIAADPMTGVLTVNNETTLSLIEKLHDARKNKTGEDRKQAVKDILNSWAYVDQAWKQYAPQNVGNSFKEFHDRTSGKEFRLDSFASYDRHGDVVYDHGKMISELQEGLIKPSRYRWSTHVLPYWEMRRELTSTKNKDKITYENSTLAEEMFGKQVLRLAENMYVSEIEALVKDKGMGDETVQDYLAKGIIDKNGKVKKMLDEDGKFHRNKDARGKEIDSEITDRSKAILKTKDFSRIVTKAYLASKFAVQLDSVTRSHTGYKHIDYATRELIIAALGHIPAGIHEDETDFRNTHLTDFYFNHHDIKMIRDMAGNGTVKNFMRAFGLETATGLTQGFLKMGKDFLKEVFT